MEEIIKMGRQAKEFTKRLLPKGEKVYLEFDVQKPDKYGRLLAYVWLSDGRMLNEVLDAEREELRGLIEKHVGYTQSPWAKYILDNWEDFVDKFRKVDRSAPTRLAYFIALKY